MTRKKPALLLLQLEVLSKLELQDKINILQSSLHVRLERGPWQSQEEGQEHQRGDRDKGLPPYALRSLISLGLSFGSSLSSLAAHETA